MKYIIDSLNIKSGIGRRKLSTCSFTSNKSNIEKQYDIVEAFIGVLDTPSLDKVSLKLTQIRDIHTTIKNLRQRVVLSDIELFEIKSFCITSDEIRAQIEGIFTLLKIPSQHEIIKILDPHGNRIPTFYIYDEYSTELADIRKQIKSCTGEVEQATLIDRGNEIEDSIRSTLSRELRIHITSIEMAYDVVGEIDFGIAKAEQAKKWGLCRPAIGGDKIAYKALFNPHVQAILEECGKSYQPMNITLSTETTILTGANMTGKTLLMKTLALSQIMCQMGFFVPAVSASLPLFDDVELCVDDTQNELTGLSSYAAEILNIDRIVKRVKSKEYLLILIDELARTTNPEEGKAIVSAVATILNNQNAITLISTHYSSITSTARRIKMKGLVINKLNENISINNINDFVDYSIIDDDDTDTTNHALLIAKILNIDDEIINLAKEYH